MFCENCGTKLEDGALFCPECGAKMAEDEQQVPVPAMEDDDEKTVMVRVTPQPVENVMEQPPVEQTESPKTVFCPQCGSVNEPTSAFCLSCGAPMNGSAPAGGLGAASQMNNVNGAGGQQPDGNYVVQDINQMAQKKQKMPKTPKKPADSGKKKKVIALIASVVAALVLVVGGIFVAKLLMGSSSGKARTELLYLKDESLFKTSLKKIKPVELDDEAYASDSTYAPVNVNPRYTKNGRYVFYFQLDDDEKSLYYVDLKAKDADPVKVASDVNYGMELTDDNHVIYNRSDSLYIQDVKGNKEKLASDVADVWRLSADQKQILWVDSEGTIYVRDIAMKNDKMKVESDTDSFLYASEDFKYIVYVKESKMYLKKDFEEKEKISQDSFSFAGAVEDEKGIQIIYAERDSDDSVVTLAEFVEDNEKAAEGYDEWTLEYVREDLKYYELGSKCKLKAYDSATGEKTTIVEGMLDDGFVLGSLDGKAAVGYVQIDEDSIPHWAIGKVCDQGVSAFYSEIREKMQRKLYLVVGTEVVDALDDDRLYSQVLLDEKEKDFYIVSLVVDQGKNSLDLVDYELGKIGYGSKGFSSYEELYKDVNILIDVKDGDVIYGINEDKTGETVELYKNDKKIDSDVDPYQVWIEDDGNILYYTDVDSHDSYQELGTAKLFTGKNSTKIADDVRRATYISEKMIPVLIDFDKNHGTSDLKLYDGKKLETIDTDVRNFFYDSGKEEEVFTTSYWNGSIPEPYENEATPVEEAY